jgi:Zn-dependent protease
MGLLNLLLNDPMTFVLLAIPLMYSVVLHELAHGWVAWRMGDPTGSRCLSGLRLRRPCNFAVGTIMLFIFGFGWAKPVPVNFNYIRDTKKGMILVSSAGIIVNMILAFLAFLLFRLLFYLAQINIILAAFNLIPIPPLDGSKILMGFLPERWQDALSRVEPYGFFLIIGLLFLGVLTPLVAFFRGIILAIIRFLLP